MKYKKEKKKKEQQDQLQKPTTNNHDTIKEQTYTTIDEKTATSIINSVKDKIAIYDMLSKADVKCLKEKHAMTIRKYSFPYDAIINDLVYPPFLQGISSTIPAQQN
jgi:hypothetical protein